MSLILACSECGTPANDGTMACERCGELLAFTFDAPPLSAATLRSTLAARRLSNAHIDRSGVWRYRELLPPIAHDAIVTLRENAVPLYPARRGASYAGLERLSYLHLGMNPTGSFKDAGMTVAISHARASGARVAICASTGNTAASMAAYAARAGMAAVVLVPAGGISEGKMAQTLDAAAHVVALEGDFDDALRVVRTMDPRAVAIVNSVNPYRIEGQKCAALQLLEARDWRVPDWVVLPGGNLGNASALGKGFREALALGLIDRLPRLAVVQASGAAPFARAFAHGTPLEPVKAQTSATAIKIGAPASWKKADREVRTTRGTVLAVDDAAIADAKATIGADGIGCEPASAASLAGARELAVNGTIDSGEDVVLVLTGHVLKDAAYAAAYHRSDAAFANPIRHAQSAADVAAIVERLADATPA